MVPRVLLRCCFSPRPVFLPVPAFLSPPLPKGLCDDAQTKV
jgi:hypothetical protein